MSNQGEDLPRVDARGRFHGTETLYGHQAVRSLAAAHVCVIGLGGVGSWAAEALARSAVGRLTLVDLDHVAESNINRQVHALDETLGASKIAAMQARIGGINPACRVALVDDWVSPDNLDALLGDGFDVVIDCIDSSRVKAALIAWCRRRKQRLITVGGAGGRSDPTRVRVADLSRSEHDPLLSRTRKQLRQKYGFPTNPQRRFGIRCVYSNEQARPPRRGADGETSGALSCAGGIGSAVMVTATMGLTAAAQAVDRILLSACEG